MKTFRRVLRLLVFVALAFGLALYLRLRAQAPAFTINNHLFRPDAGSTALSAALVLILLLGLWALLSQIWTKNSRLNYKEALALDFPTYLPAAFFIASPLALARYLTRDDLVERLGLLAVGVAAAVLYLKIVRVLQADRDGKSRWGAGVEKALALPLRRRVIALFFASLIAFNLGSLLRSEKGASFGGDEPHYLLMTHSLLEDRDLDLADNYENGDYYAYVPEGALIRPHTQPGRKVGSLYSMHSPGISFLLLPFYAFGLALGKGALAFFVRFGMSLAGAFLAVQMYLYAREAWNREKLALGIWALAGLTAPVFFYAGHIYPEIVVAAAGLYAFRRLRFGKNVRAGELAFIGFLLASFVWFHALKYAFILAPLLLYAVTVVWTRSGTGGRARRLGFLLAPAALCALAYFAFQYALYGSLNPTAVSWQGAMDARQSLGFIKEMITGIPFKFRWETLAGYFLDQRDGLLLYAPVYAFAFLGLISMLRDRRRLRDAGWLLLIGAPYVLVSAFLTQRTGYAPQARPLVAVIWILAIFAGEFLAGGGKRFFRVLFNAAAVWSAAVVWIQCRHPFSLYMETTSNNAERAGDLFVTLSNLHFYLPNLLPSFIKVEEGPWGPNLWWIAALGLFIAAFAVVRRHDFRIPFPVHAVLTAVFLAGFFAMSVLFPRVVLVSPRPAALPGGVNWTFHSLSRVARMSEPARFDILQDNRDYNFYFTSAHPLETLAVDFGSPHGDYNLSLSIADDKVFEAPTRREILTREIHKPPAYRWRGLSLYRVSITLERKSEVRTAVTPYVFGLRPVR